MNRAELGGDGRRRQKFSAATQSQTDSRSENRQVRWAKTSSVAPRSTNSARRPAAGPARACRRQAMILPATVSDHQKNCHRDDALRRHEQQQGEQAFWNWRSKIFQAPSEWIFRLSARLCRPDVSLCLLQKCKLQTMPRLRRWLLQILRQNRFPARSRFSWAKVFIGQDGVLERGMARPGPVGPGFAKWRGRQICLATSACDADSDESFPA